MAPSLSACSSHFVLFVVLIITYNIIIISHFLLYLYLLSILTVCVLIMSFA